jgi:hypothetical protein
MCLHTLSQNACVRTQHNHHKNPCYLKWSSPGIYKWVPHKQSNSVVCLLTHSSKTEIPVATYSIRLHVSGTLSLMLERQPQ